MGRVSLGGRGQALDGDSTTTGAVCQASGAGYLSAGRKVLRVGDATTPCPECGEPGVVVEGYLGWLSDGQPLAMDGSVVACGCPKGHNRVVAPLHAAPGLRTRSAPARPGATETMARGTTGNAQPQLVTALPGPGPSFEPGFHIVRRSQSGPQLLAELFEHDPRLPIARLQRLNPTFEDGFKAGEIFVLGDPDNHHACTLQEAELMAAAQRAREALAELDEQDANFMMAYISEIAGVLNGASQSMGVGKDMLAHGVSQVSDTLKAIERLHQREFGLHGHLKSPQFFASRQALYHQLDAQLRSAFLGKYLSLGSHENLRKGLRISTKSLVHHWSKAGAPGAIPGYATHLDEVAKLAKYMNRGGHVAVGMGGVSSYLKVQEVCRAGETEACKKIRLTEAGNFSGAVAGGGSGGQSCKSCSSFDLPVHSGRESSVWHCIRRWRILSRCCRGECCRRDDRGFHVRGCL